MFSGPASGKSITAINVRAKLGFKGYDIELVEETIKEWTYIPRIPSVCDTHFIQANQIQKEDIRLRAGVDIIVSDSPLMLQYFYAIYHKNPMQEPMRLAAVEFEKMYPSINIFIDREDKFYNEVGRYEKLDEAKKIDNLIKDTLVLNDVPFVSFSCLDQKNIVKYIIEGLE